MTDLDFTLFLVAHGLSVAGSTETIHDLERRHGIRRWFDFQEVIDLPAASLFPEQTEGFFLRRDRTCLLPPCGLECDFDYYRDGPRTHACARERLTSLFGTPEEGEATNTLCDTWRFERMSLRILTFLREKTRARSPLYDRHPELWNFCRISIDRNWVLPTNKEDAETIGSLDGSQVLSVDRRLFRTIAELCAWERGLFRLSTDGRELRPNTPFLWKQGAIGGASIGWCAGPWSGIFERPQCVSLILDRVEGDRGPAYSRLALLLRNPFSLEQEPVETVILTGSDRQTLDLLASEVSDFWQLPMNMREYRND